MSFKSKAQYERYKSLSPERAESLKSSMGAAFDKLPDRVKAGATKRPAKAKAKPKGRRATILGYAD